MWYSQRITIQEIEKHAWTLKAQVKEIKEGNENENGVRNADEYYVSQSIEEVLAIIEEARKPGPETSNHLLDGSVDLDELDTTDEDIDTSEEFVCALWSLQLFFIKMNRVGAYWVVVFVSHR